MPTSASVTPAVVVMAYNRPHSLQRLLNSLALATYPSEGVPLVISIDHSDTDQVLQLAQKFHWPHGSKEVIAHEANLGLREHALACGDLTERYEYVIFLEDDLLVSPAYYMFAQQAVARYSSQPTIAGVSLYTFCYYEQAAIPFNPLPDNSDVYFLQYPASWGSVVFRRSWQKFRAWLAEGQQILPTDLLPVGVKKFWSDKSWVKYYLKYMVTQQLYYVYPRISYSTTFSDVGVHHATINTKYQVPLQLMSSPSPRWIEFEESYAVYDVFFELLPDRLNRLVPELTNYNYLIDLNATKEAQLYPQQYILTTQKAREHIKSYAYQLKPAVMNVIYQLPGHAIKFCRKEHLTTQARQQNNVYFHSYLSFSQLFTLLRRKLNCHFKAFFIKRCLSGRNVLLTYLGKRK